MFESCSMILREFISNNQIVLSKINAIDKLNSLNQKILGMLQNLEEDAICFPKIFAKSRVKPKKFEKLSIHRMELLSAFLGARVLKFLDKELNRVNKFDKLKVKAVIN